MLFSIPIAKERWKFISLIIMEILKAIVEPYRPSDPENIINAVLLPGPVNIKVKYTSPNHQRYFYGMYAPPAVGSEILVYSDNLEYYYLTTVVGHGEMLGQISKDVAGNAAPLYSDKKMIDPSGNPTAMFFKNHKDAGLKIQNYYAQGESIVNQVELKSSKNHQVILSDSPQANAVVIKNGDGDYIAIGGDLPVPYTPSPAGYISRGIELNSLNSQQCIVTNGEYKVTVTNGRDITLENKSEGLFRYYVPDPTQVGIVNPLLMFGNINLISKYRDINIFTDNPVGPALPGGIRESNVFISTQWGVVQINSGGDVKIFSKQGGVTVQALNDINITSQTGNINLTANQVNINSRTATNIKANTTLTAYGLTQTNLGAGTPLYLNKPGTISPQVIPPPEIPKLNAYGK
jgi:hypothetical protein